MGIKKLLWRAFPVLPLVYDDTLSFYEVLSKITNAVNQLIDNVNGLDEAIARLEGTVTSVNNVTADADGNVELTPADIGAKPANYEAPVDSVNGKIGAVELSAVELGGVTKVNGLSPDSTGNVVLPTIAAVSSVNNVLPDGDGNVSLTASDVGAKPASYEAPVSSVNNKTGAVQLTASDVAAVPAGQGVPSGGTTGQSLVKSSNTDHALEWHNAVLRFGNANRFNGAILDIDISNYQTDGGYAFLLIVQDWVTFGDSTVVYLVNGIAGGQYQLITALNSAVHGPQSVSFQDDTHIRVTFYNNAGGYWAIAPILHADL